MENRTSKTQIVRQLRQLWLRSKERSTALKEAGYCCQSCGKKKSIKKGQEQKIEVHHIEGISNWDHVVKIIQEEILCDPSLLKVLCPECHAKEE